MKEVFIPKKFSAKHEQLIRTADAIMRNYASQGYDLSLRQLYYQFVAHHGLPNSEQSYKMLGGVISDARLAGLLDWSSMVDRGRDVTENPHWDTPADIINAAAASYRIDLWDDQPYHVMVMVEKQALEGVLIPVCRDLDIAFTANRGYSSSSHLYSIGQEIAHAIEQGKKVRVIYLGDHDPSGIDMTRDVAERLALFSRAGWYDQDDKQICDVETDELQVIRVALNMDQVREYNPPPNPTKLTDSRATGYIDRYGMECWELDALDPSTLANLVTSTVEGFMDIELMEYRKQRWKLEKDTLYDMARRYALGEYNENRD